MTTDEYKDKEAPEQDERLPEDYQKHLDEG